MHTVDIEGNRKSTKQKHASMFLNAFKSKKNAETAKDYKLHKYKHEF